MIQSLTFHEETGTFSSLRTLEMGGVIPQGLRLGLFKAIRLKLGTERMAKFLKKVVSVNTRILTLTDRRILLTILMKELATRLYVTN